MPDDHALLSLLLITMLAAIVPLLAAGFKRFHIPVVIGEIIAGILIGKSGLHVVEPSQILDFLSEFGFVILMFISGLEVDINSFSATRLRNREQHFWRTPILLALLSFTLALGSAFTVAFLLSQWGFIQNFLILGLILSATSLGIVVPVLKEREIIATNYGQLILLAAPFADFITLVLLSLALGMMSKGKVLQLTVLRYCLPLSTGQPSRLERAWQPVSCSHHTFPSQLPYRHWHTNWVS